MADDTRYKCVQILEPKARYLENLYLSYTVYFASRPRIRSSPDLPFYHDGILRRYFAVDLGVNNLRIKCGRDGWSISS